MGILWGLTSAICWGTADFIARFATQRAGTYRTVFWVQFLGFLGLSVFLFFAHSLDILDRTIDWQTWAWLIVASSLSTFSGLAVYRSFKEGTLAIVSPIVASYAAVTVVLAILTGEVISTQRGLGIVVTLGGVALSAISPMPPSVAESASSARRWRGLPRGVEWALLGSISFGVVFWILGVHVVPVMGGVVPIWFARGIATIVLICLPAVRPIKGLARPLANVLLLPRAAVMLIIGAGVLDTAAYVANAVGLTSGQIAIVNVMASLFSAVTVVMAWVFLRERLRATQWLGIALIFAGVALITL